MLVISMRTRRFLGIKASIIVINPGKSAVLVLAVALAAFSSSVSTALTVLIVSTVSDAPIVSGAAVAVEAVVAAAAVVDNQYLIQSLLYSKRKSPAFCRGFSLEGYTYETNPGT